MKGNLYLVPTPLGDMPPDRILSPHYLDIIRRMSHFAVEEIRTARRFLRKVDREFDIDGATFFVLNKKTPESEVGPMLKPLLEGMDMGIISEAGMPAIADPGSLLVREAHRQQITVVPIPGPSSILLALSGSGLNGQNFTFHGYLPIREGERKSKIREIESLAYRTGATQIFMETPYRNQAMVESLLSVCQISTTLCIAADLNLETEFIRTRLIVEWKREKISIGKRPAIFLLSGQ